MEADDPNERDFDRPDPLEALIDTDLGKNLLRLIELRLPSEALAGDMVYKRLKAAEFILPISSSLGTIKWDSTKRLLIRESSRGAAPGEPEGPTRAFNISIADPNKAGPSDEVSVLVGERGEVAAVFSSGGASAGAKILDHLKLLVDHEIRQLDSLESREAKVTPEQLRHLLLDKLSLLYASACQFGLDRVRREQGDEAFKNKSIPQAWLILPVGLGIAEHTKYQLWLRYLPKRLTNGEFEVSIKIPDIADSRHDQLVASARIHYDPDDEAAIKISSLTEEVSQSRLYNLISGASNYFNIYTKGNRRPPKNFDA
ncbi:MAG TPA: hypothetical protein VGA08_01985 [Candidatus Saccharimonadales bacterium]